MSKRLIFLGLSLISMALLSGCSHSSGSSSNTSTVTLTSNSSTVYAGYNGPSASFVVTVGLPTTNTLEVDDSSAAAQDISISSGLPTGVTASYNDGWTTSSTGCASVPVGGSCTITLTSSQTSASNLHAVSPTLNVVPAPTPSGLPSDSSTSTLTITASNASSITLPLTLEWPSFSLSPSSVSNTDATTITLSNSSDVPAEITNVELAQSVSSTLKVAVPSVWTLSNSNCENVTLAPSGSAGSSCTFTLQASGYSTTPASISINGSNLNSTATAPTVSTATNSGSITYSGDFDSGSSSDMTFQDTTTKQLVISNTNGFSLPITWTSSSSGFSNYTVTAGSGCTSSSSVGSPIIYVPAANGSTPGQCTLDITPSDLTPAISAVTFSVAGHSSIFNWIIPTSVNIVVEHESEQYPAYEVVKITNDSGQALSNIQYTINNDALSIVSHLNSSDTPPPSTDFPQGDTCLSQTIANGASCYTWFKATGGGELGSDPAGSITVAYDIGGAASSTTLSFIASNNLYATQYDSSDSSYAIYSLYDANGVENSTGNLLATVNNNPQFIWSLAVDNYGVLYAGGFYNAISDAGSNSIAAFSIAKYTNAGWSALADNSSDGHVAGLYLDVNSSAKGYANSVLFNPNNNELYVGGMFTTQINGDTSTIGNNIAAWNTHSNSWSTLGTSGSNGVDGGDVAAMLLDSNQLYVGGNFTTVYDANGSQSYNSIADWDINTGSWTNTTLASGLSVNQPVYSIAIYNGQVYMGGSFSVSQGADTATGIAYYNGSSWQPLKDGSTDGIYGVSTAVYAMRAFNGQLLVGGDFAGVGYSSNGSSWSISAPGIALWQAGTPGVWSSVSGLATTPSNSYSMLTDTAGNVYIAGNLGVESNGTTCDLVDKEASNGTITAVMTSTNANCQNLLNLGLAIGASLNISN